ncbi:MAG: response regulator [Roseburia sp.]|nr:response regulator [Roseburia sp.]
MNSKARILAVDDNAISLKAIDLALRNEYEVITVNSGERAIRYLLCERPDLILLDIQMAHKDGIETLKEIRTMKNGADIPVIMLTSKNDRETIIESSRLGINDYVLKPFDSDQLLGRIRQTLEKAAK